MQVRSYDRRMQRLPFLILLSLCLLVGCSRAPRELVLSGPTMGTTYTIKVVGTPGQIDAEALRRTIDTVLTEIDLEMSVYRPDSVISRFNASTSTEWIEVPLGLARVVAAAQSVSRASGGALDITVAPLVQLWGFGARSEPTSLPTEEQIAALRERVGFERLEVRLHPAALRKQHAALMIDVNGVAPGYAVDVLADRFIDQGIENFLIDLGGEVVARGRNPDGVPWRIAVERPLDTEPTPFRVIELADRAVTTSGEYRHYYERDGKRYSHTIDPRTGHPIESRGSVAIAGDTALEVDAWSTALNVLGAQAGLELAEREGLAVMYVLVEGSELTAHKSSRWSELFGEPSS